MIILKNLIIKIVFLVLPIIIREKLYNFIRFADDKKVKALYTIFEKDLLVKDSPWNEESFIKELERRTSEYEKNPKMSSSWEEVIAKTKKT